MTIFTPDPMLSTGAANRLPITGWRSFIPDVLKRLTGTHPQIPHQSLHNRGQTFHNRGQTACLC